MPSAEGAPQTLYDKIISDHIVDEKLDGTVLIYIGMFTKKCEKGRRQRVLGNASGAHSFC